MSNFAIIHWHYYWGHPVTHKPLTLQQKKKLAELRKKHLPDMALHKAEHGEDIDKMSDHDKLLILIISDISTSVSACVNEMCDDLYDQKILNQHELATVISRVLLQTATDFIERAIELEPERDMELTEEILFAFNDLRPDVQAIVFEEDGIHVFDNKVRDENEDEEDDEYEQ